MLRTKSNPAARTRTGRAHPKTDPLCTRNLGMVTRQYEDSKTEFPMPNPVPCPDEVKMQMDKLRLQWDVRVYKRLGVDAVLGSWNNIP
ncbi:hypothetical protein VC83_05142 [Pseudogymnoascus destructans]|uniref:Uncharacterized protein n=1 Tax=Pseudogymnoascus destructans TaxID=655981 RepID=A0A177AC05_9PEZI|nr:uncharacterized protein VC83_05142 [Pseudogymnoascus destructans]OAF58714.1 hypothetical protein VC83_05142 [Pseudogymnoascus destructans]